MNKRLVTILLLALVIAGACATLVYKVVGNRLGASTPAATRVVAAAADIKIGTLLTPSNLTTIDIAGAVPKGAIVDPKAAVGRGVVEDIYQGEPILRKPTRCGWLRRRSGCNDSPGYESDCGEGG